MKSVYWKNLLMSISLVLLKGLTGVAIITVWILCTAAGFWLVTLEPTVENDLALLVFTIVIIMIVARYMRRYWPNGFDVVKREKTLRGDIKNLLEPISSVFVKKKQDEDGFSTSIRLYTAGLLKKLKTEGESAVKEDLKSLFADKTLEGFPDKLTKKSLRKTLENLKEDEVIYRDARFNKNKGETL